MLFISSVSAQKNDKLKEELASKEIKPVPNWTKKQIYEKVDSVLALMSLDEKIGQLYQIGTPMGDVSDLGEVNDVRDPSYYLKKGCVGSILGNKSALKAYELQKYAVEETRLGIPLFFDFDVIHGHKTIFPVNLGLACSWDMDAVEQSCAITAKESTVSGTNFHNGPMIDVSRDARWGRCTEGVGEDPYLGSLIARASVRGYQGDDLTDRHTMIACGKHFAAYGAVEAGRDYNTVDISERTLREIYFPPFKAAVDEGIGSLMPSFNVIDGVPCAGNEWLLKTVGREEWGFEGIYLSDFNSIHELVIHGLAKDDAEASILAMNATLDQEMVSQAYVLNLKKLVKQGKVSLHQVDASVKRILRYKFELGLFDDPYRYIDIKGEETIHCAPEHKKAAREIATKSMVLLKNDTITETQKTLLPISKDTKSIALIGPFVKTKEIEGAWAWGDRKHLVTVKEGFVNRLGEDFDLKVVEGYRYRGKQGKRRDWDKALQAAKESELVVLCMGEPQGYSGEAASRAELDFPGEQKELAEEILKLNKPTILVVFTGRPLVMKWYHDNFPSILCAWFPGTETGNALTDVLFGDVNPSGKLVMSFPYHVGQCPVYYNHLNTGRPYTEGDNNRFVSRYMDIPNKPLYEFGYGLSYTTFEYSDITISNHRLKSGKELKVSVNVKNTGDYDGEETVQLYIHDIVASVARPVKELKDFKKVMIKSGENRTVEFTITEEQLKYWNKDMKYDSDAGDFNVFVGTSSDKYLKTQFEFIK
ncbi:beta-glucosidase BglX [Labilibacter sediminis]|nr:beta-glucosidase BglX [Labilibacter sediminis]